MNENEIEKINFEEKEKERKRKKEDKSILIRKMQILLKECKEVQASSLEKGTKNDLFNMRARFNFWLGKRKELEILEERCYELKLDHFDKEYLKKIIKVICDNLLKLFSPPKRKYALKLLENFKIPSTQLTWENLNAFSSPYSLSVGSKNQCATCSKKLGLLSIFSKRTDEQGNVFCGKNCFDKFYDLYCDKCNEIKVNNPSYYINEKEKEGIICFECIKTECLRCKKTISHSVDYLSQFFPWIDSKSGEQDFSQKNYSPLCKSCQVIKKINS